MMVKALKCRTVGYIASPGKVISVWLEPLKGSGLLDGVFMVESHRAGATVRAVIPCPEHSE
jgi:hypothetical protein